MERLAGRVDDDVRDAARRELGLHRLAEVGEDGDHAGRPASEDALDPAATRRPPALHLAEDDREVMLAGDALDAADDLERPFALELVEDHLEERRPAARPGRPLVAVLADRGLDPATASRRRRPSARSRPSRRSEPRPRSSPRCPPWSSDPTDRGASGWATSRPQCNELDRATKVSCSTPAVGAMHLPAPAARFGRIIDKSRTATLQWPSRNYRRALRNFRGGDPRPSGCPRRIGDNERGYRRFRPARLLLPGRGGIALVGRPGRDRGRTDDRIGGDVIAHRARSRVVTRPVPRGGFGQ